LAQNDQDATVKRKIQRFSFSEADTLTQVRVIASEAWGELHHLRAWDRSGLVQRCLIQELP
jgi:hypothetical protein